MHLKLFLSFLTLLSATLAGVLNVNIYTDSDESPAEASHHRHQSVLSREPEIRPAWKKRDDLHVIPLVPEARTGLIPVEAEEGLIYAAGPRFANKIIQETAKASGNSSAAAFGCIGCIGTIIKLGPCIAAAARCGCIDPLLKCGVSEADICKCIDCLPDIIKELLKKVGLCSSSVFRPATEELDITYANFIPYSRRDPNLLAYRGDLPETTLEDAEAEAAAGFCPGVPCPDCPCCLGVCIPIIGKCAGVCLATDSPQIGHGREEL